MSTNAGWGGVLGQLVPLLIDLPPNVVQLDVVVLHLPHVRRHLHRQVHLFLPVTWSLLYFMHLIFYFQNRTKFRNRITWSLQIKLRCSFIRKVHNWLLNAVIYLAVKQYSNKQKLSFNFINTWIIKLP